MHSKIRNSVIKEIYFQSFRLQVKFDTQQVAVNVSTFWPLCPSFSFPVSLQTKGHTSTSIGKAMSGSRRQNRYHCGNIPLKRGILQFLDVVHHITQVHSAKSGTWVGMTGLGHKILLSDVAS